tara:strand:+ start:4288 stop:5199 length:912 start_codon:yes stop_codon:yes gene_type:complete
MNELNDQLSWKKFIKESSKEKIIKEVKPYNRLIAHTKNFFVISGYGSFTEGYVLIITKDFIPSYGLIKREMLVELNFLKKILKLNSKNQYDKDVVFFEHGMCACVGGLDRAHLHVMTVNKKTSEDSLSRAIEKVLYKRKVGIKSIKYKKYKLENIHDINEFMNDSRYTMGKDYTIEGKLLELRDIKNLEVEKWPFVTEDHIKSGGHYVYFKSSYLNSSFLTKKNFQTQFGRQVIYENEMDLSFEFRSQINKLIDENKFLEPWKWQSCIFEENLIKTVNDMRNSLKNNKNSFLNEVHTFEFKVL